ncbi:MAG TPA: hypothetical protein VG826_03835 [Pirellulales bacterium]|nr:hypothetical protein [Pirellulales bacterium]
MSDALSAGDFDLHQRAAECASGRFANRFQQLPWPRLDVRGRQNASLLGLLVLLELIATALTPVGSSVTESYWDYMLMASMGASLAAPALLALWAVFGPQPIAFRLPATAWLAAAQYLGLMYGESRNAGKSDCELAYFGIWMLGFVILQSPLWLLRAARRWRLTLDPATCVASETAGHHVPPRARGHFTLRSVFFWTLAAAVLLAVLRTLTADAAPKLADVLAGLPDACIDSLFVVLGGLPVIPLAWIVLAAGRRPVLRIVLTALLLAGVAGGIPLFLYLEEGWDGWPELAAIVGGTIVNGLLSLTVILFCGYRLDRQPRASVANAHLPVTPSGLVERTPLSVRRLAMGFLPLLVLAGALALALPQRLEEWRRADVTAEWEPRGFQVAFDDDGRISYLTYERRRHVSDEACRQIARLPALETLHLTGSKIDDRQLALLAPLPSLLRLSLRNCEVTDAGLKELRRLSRLESLDLVNTRVSDAGLAHLAALSNLQSLELAVTEISDDGLKALPKLPRLSHLDVSLTAVSRAGADEFRRACPGVELDSGACDFQVGCLLADAKSRAALGVPPLGLVNQIVPLERLHLRGEKTVGGTVFRVTDKAIVELLKEAPLEELDLRETAITDNGLLALAKLAGLKRLDLRGTSVSEQAVARLAESLPSCQIVVAGTVRR